MLGRNGPDVLSQFLTRIQEAMSRLVRFVFFVVRVDGLSVTSRISTAFQLLRLCGRFSRTLDLLLQQFGKQSMKRPNVELSFCVGIVNQF
jgi:hypothetical protein